MFKNFVNVSHIFPSDPFSAVFGSESFGGGFADFSALAKVDIAEVVCPYGSLIIIIMLTRLKMHFNN